MKKILNFRINRFHLTYIILLFILSVRFQTFDSLPQDHLINHIIPNQKHILTGVINQPPEKFLKKTRININSEILFINGKSSNVSGETRVTVYESGLSYQYGDRVEIRGVRLRKPRNFKNEGAFDYESYLENKNIYVTGSISNESKMKLINRDNGFYLLKIIYGFKDQMLKSLNDSLPYRNASIIKAMVLGDRGTLSKEDRELFVRSGTSHLMAVSGLHVGFIAFMAFRIIRSLTGILMIRFFLEKALSGWINPLSALFTMVPVIVYMVLIGWKSSSVRAGIMVIVYLAAMALSRQKEIYRSILVAAYIILLWKPLSFQDVGFQLSFIAVLTIVFCYKEITLKNNAYSDIPLKENKFLKILYGNMAVSLFAVLGTAPLIFYYFNRISPYAFFANIIAVPLAALIIPGAMISMLIFPVFHWAGILGLKIISLITSLLLIVIEFFSYLPLASLRFATPPLLAVICFYLFAFLLIKFRSSEKNRWILIPVGAVLIVSLSSNYISFSQRKDLKVTFLDVGQGDSTLLEFPGGATMLIDGGGLFGDFDVGESVVAPFLWDRGIEKVDYVIPTHSDNDHIEGLFYVLKEMRVGMLWSNSLIPFKTKMINLEELSKINKISIGYDYILTNNFNVKIEKFHPTEGFVSNYLDKKENNYSTVLKVSYGDISFLFPSDIEHEAEEYLVKEYGSELEATILKVPHHGSKTSSTSDFINAVNPEVAVVSAGLFNRFHHPVKKVIARYKKKGIRIYRTDIHGAVTITTDGVKYEIKIFNQ